MKDVSFLNSSVAGSNSRQAILKFDHMNQNQGRTFGPLLGLFLVNLLSKAVTAKYDNYLPVRLSLDPSPWLAYNKPLASYNYHSYYPHQWYPVKSPHQDYHAPSYHKYPTLTTAEPYTQNEDWDYEDSYERQYREENDYYGPTYNPNHIDRLIPAESSNVKRQELPPPKFVNETTTQEFTNAVPPQELPTQKFVNEITTQEPEKLNASTATPEASDKIDDLMTAESSMKGRRAPNQRKRKRGPSRREKYPQKRRRTTTPSSEYYDSYEDYTTNNRRTRRPPASYYDEEDDEDEDEYYDSFEATTRYYKNQKRRPTRKPIKNQKINRRRPTTYPPPPQNAFEFVPVVERVGPTEIVIVRQAQQMPPTTTTSTTTTTTTEPPTFITNGTTTPQTTTSATGINATTTYGYGPSNGNEGISFTYGPPVRQYQYTGPYFDWYAQEAARNAIVKRVRDIVSYDRRYRVKK